jgi:3-methyladenine DNA glycosylase AlkC
MRRATEASHAALPVPFPQAVAVLKQIAPRLPKGFVGIFLPDFIGQHGHDHFDESMAALQFLTPFSSAEFAIREFLKRDLKRALAVMERWSRDENEHVRRLACEGCRPRLPWSFHLTTLIADPAPVAGILENLRADPSLYVRKSVANHLNDITKNHPDWVLDRLAEWDRSQPPTQWIAKRACRTLLKAGHPRALQLFEFTRQPAVQLTNFRLAPRRIRLGGTIRFAFSLTSTGTRSQHLSVDYLVHYVKAAGGTAPKVFKLREVRLGAGEKINLQKHQTIRDFTTRRHYAGRHKIEIQVNGRSHGGGTFLLAVP